MDISVICVVRRCHLPPVDTPKGSVWLLEISFIFFLDQFIPISYMTNIYVLKYRPLKMAITQVQCLLTIQLKMSHFIRSVLDHGRCGTKIKLLSLEVYSSLV